MRSKDQNKLAKIFDYINDYFETNRETPTIDEISTHLSIGRTTAQRYLVELDRRGDIKYRGRQGIETERIAKMKGGNLNVALVGSIACGEPTFAEENIEEYFSLPESLIGRGKFYLLRANGKSMIKVGIDDGDLVLIKQQDQAYPGDIVVALCEETDTTLKRYYPEEDCIRLHPENDEMEDIFVDHCIIQGVAVKVLKDL